MHLEKPVLGQLTQGTIFTAACAENYPQSPVWGLCITARCDVAHENKTKVFNYLPLIRYEDWLLEDGVKIIVDRIGAEIFGSAKELLKRKGISESILESYSPKEVAGKFFPLNSGDKDSLRFHEIADKINKLNEARTISPVSKSALVEVASYGKKTVEKFTKELWANQLASYYFLPSIGDTEHASDFGYIVLLREVYHISRVAANEVACGAFPDNKALACPTNKAHDFSVFDFSYPISKLKSPWIEHIMQQFSMLFSRIGLPDPVDAVLNNLMKALNHDESSI